MTFNNLGKLQYRETADSSTSSGPVGPAELSLRQDVVSSAEMRTLLSTSSTTFSLQDTLGRQNYVLSDSRIPCLFSTDEPEQEESAYPKISDHTFSQSSEPVKSW